MTTALDESLRYLAHLSLPPSSRACSPSHAKSGPTPPATSSSSSSSRRDSTPTHGWNQYTGYGGIDPGAILNTDPTQLPDENPLADKGGGSSPTPGEVRQYADGLVDPTEIVNDNSYTYRGVDETTLKNPANGYPTHIGTSPSYHAT